MSCSLLFYINNITIHPTACAYVTVFYYGGIWKGMLFL